MDARHNHPRIGRIVIGRGRDAADVPISTAFGVAKLVRFEVTTDEVAGKRPTRAILAAGGARLVMVRHG
jgi:transglutaminase-like putative cysteine protease